MEEAGNKRLREADVVGEGDTGSPPASPEAKRIRANLFFDILDDESEPDNTDIDSVMRSLEEEISLPVASSDSVTEPAEPEGGPSGSDPKQTDLGFLLEASDDELGLPPAEAAEGVASSIVAAGEEHNAGVELEEVGFGKIWGLDDEIHLDFGFGCQQDNDGDDGGVIFDGGLFDYDGGICGPAEFSDLTWRPEFLPAL